MVFETHADECELTIRILGDGPSEGMSMKEIQDSALQRFDRVWSLMKINDVLCAIRPHITHEKVRRKTGKVTLYRLRSDS